MTVEITSPMDAARDRLVESSFEIPAVAEAMRIYLAAAPRVPTLTAQRVSVSFSTSTSLR
ncbi:hypothetical protein [Arthrobacter sp. PAMC 25486]|uniref:hypothetical protein n=1 Tax=Arthrobacter sp. PAMC 25486 TaxID=1494608 RepID=UPI00138E425E|nr:hypothetical protein [Arthrobacter sp. PAMC 25486]